MAAGVPVAAGVADAPRSTKTATETPSGTNLLDLCFVMDVTGSMGSTSQPRNKTSRPSPTDSRPPRATTFGSGSSPIVITLRRIRALSRASLPSLQMSR